MDAARRARDGAWGRLAPAEKGRLLGRLSRAILDHADELALIEARDCGKPMKQARADVAACARYFEFYGGASDKLHGETIPYPAGYTVLTWREPHGVTGHIIPWNYPMQIFGRSVGGALAAGNACVVKPAEDACLSVLRVAELAAAIGLPDGALNIVTGLGREAGAALAMHRGIDHLSFTGSPATGACGRRRGREAPLSGDARARRQGTADRLRRRRPRRGAARDRQRDRAERRADVLRRQPSRWSSGRATRSCWRSSARVSLRSRSGPRSTISIAGR